MSSVTKPRAVFGVVKKYVPGVLIRAMAMYDGLNGDPATFSAPPISVIAFLALITALAQAQQKTKEIKGKVISTARDTHRDALWTAMVSLRAYVQSLADSLSGQAALELISSAGLLVAGVSVHAKPVLSASLTVTPGTVHLSANRKALAGAAHRGRRLFFNWEMSADGGRTWTALPPTPYASTDVTGLAALTTYSFRVSVTVGKVTEPWSQAVSILVH